METLRDIDPWIVGCAAHSALLFAAREVAVGLRAVGATYGRGSSGAALGSTEQEVAQNGTLAAGDRYRVVLRWTDRDGRVARAVVPG